MRLPDRSHLNSWQWSGPVPIVLVSGRADVGEHALSFRALEAGALTVLPRPAGFGHPAHAAGARDLIRTVKTMAEVKLVRRWGGAPTGGELPPPPVGAPSPTSGIAVRAVVVGASTGGPPVLAAILAGLPKDFPLPVLIVQHIAADFTAGLVEWLGLTRMGQDGAAELRHLYTLGAPTIAQDAASSVVHGMPGEPIRLGGARYILAPAQIAPRLASLATPAAPALPGG